MRARTIERVLLILIGVAVILVGLSHAPSASSKIDLNLPVVTTPRTTPPPTIPVFSTADEVMPGPNTDPVVVDRMNQGPTPEQTAEMTKGPDQSVVDEMNALKNGEVWCDEVDWTPGCRWRPGTMAPDRVLNPT